MLNSTLFLPFMNPLPSFLLSDWTQFAGQGWPQKHTNKMDLIKYSLETFYALRVVFQYMVSGATKIAAKNAYLATIYIYYTLFFLVNLYTCKYIYIIYM